MLANFQSYPGSWSIFADALIDYYSSTTDTKHSGLEWTETNVSVDKRFGSVFGTGLFLSSFRWPDLKRNAALSITTDLVEQGSVDRGGLRAWWQANSTLRLDGRIDRWQDETTTGSGGEVRIGLRDLLYQRGEVGLAAFRSDSRYGSNQGLRVEASKRVASDGFLRTSYTWTRYDQENSLSSTEFDQHLIQASYDDSLTEDWDYSLYLQDSFGGDSDTIALGLLVTRRL